HEAMRSPRGGSRLAALARTPCVAPPPRRTPVIPGTARPPDHSTYVLRRATRRGYARSAPTPPAAGPDGTRHRSLLELYSFQLLCRTLGRRFGRLLLLRHGLGGCCFSGLGCRLS